MGGLSAEESQYNNFKYANYTKLEILSVKNSQLGDKALERIVQNKYFKSLKQLFINDCQRLTKKSLQKLFHTDNIQINLSNIDISNSL